jgi:hypothetical protein
MFAYCAHAAYLVYFSVFSTSDFKQSASFHTSLPHLTCLLIINAARERKAAGESRGINTGK